MYMLKVNILDVHGIRLLVCLSELRIDYDVEYTQSIQYSLPSHEQTTCTCTCTCNLIVSIVVKTIQQTTSFNKN